MTDFHERHIDAAGVRMHILEQGEGPLVLLCHGFPETSYAWRHQLTALAEAGNHAVAPDMRGYGSTESPGDPSLYTLDQHVGDLIGIMDALKVNTAVVVGSDWGGTIAWHAALTRPDRFSAVAVLGTPMMDRAPALPTSLFPQTDDALFYTLYFQTPGVAELEFESDVACTLRKIYWAASGDAGPRLEGDGTPNPFGMVSRTAGLLGPLPDPDRCPAWLTETDLERFVQAFSHSGFKGGLNYYRALDANWLLQRATKGQSITVPALFLIGERDTGLRIPGMQDIIHAMPTLVPQLRPPIVLPECGHWAAQEQPEAVNAALIAFIGSLPSEKN
ncbi:alpha/beta fold hydrolase [Schauerella aestuarii]|uniref:alpha/beta fold hydrolase n=1 Tax=Schauerella aestuarii TaxID=2511204 RepID=UPI0013720BF3|nr:alpha/beta hydrolase [Achromobacter aestuarii]MYZ41670.1 alpha/beta hydrolase [Achromobacter aestuarii]